VPFHLFIFRGMTRAIARRAEARRSARAIRARDEHGKQA
jgi:hypothetical protein